MPGVLIHPTAPLAMKRPAPPNVLDEQDRPVKRTRTVHHGIQHKQPLAQESLSGMQDEMSFQSQLLRAISLSLTSAGFDSIHPTALEAFRAEAELYMLQFLKTVRSSMTCSRRTAPTPQDFALALAHSGLSSSALLPFLNTPSELSVCQPQIPPIPAPEPSPPSLENVLGPELSSSSERQQRHYVPQHLPTLPSRHTWQATPVYPKREEDARKIRERATQEGVIAEQALRRLMAASKSGSNGKEAQGRLGRAGSKSKAVWDAAWAAIQQADNNEREKEEKADWEGEDTEIAPPVGATKVRAASNAVFDTTMIANYDRKYWRQAARGRT